MKRRPKEDSEHAQRLLAMYCHQIKKYKAQWQIPPDKQAHLNAWAAARKEVR
jgi:hypothetical protein